MEQSLGRGADFETGRGARRERRPVQDGLRAAKVDPGGGRSHLASVVGGRRRKSLRGTPRLFGQVPAQVARRKGRSRAQGRRMSVARFADERCSRYTLHAGKLICGQMYFS